MTSDKRRCYIFVVTKGGSTQHTVWVVAPSLEIAEARLLMEVTERGWTILRREDYLPPECFVPQLVDYWVGGGPDEPA